MPPNPKSQIAHEQGTKDTKTATGGALAIKQPCQFFLSAERIILIRP
jgi:hypothetical protein